jgi:hypothetical protein
MPRPKPQEEQDISTFPDKREAIDFLDRVMAVWACFPMPFFRKGVGDRVPGGPGVFAMALAWMFSYASPAWLVFYWVWFAGMIVMRLRRDKTQMSWYPGRKVVKRFIPFLRGESSAVLAECAACIAAGAFLMDYDKEFGQFVMSWCIPLGYMEAVRMQIERQMRRAIRDGQIMAGYMADLHRRG